MINFAARGLITAADWKACTDPAPLLHFVRNKGTISQWRAFAVACCRRIDHLITDERSRRAVYVAERLVQGIATQDEVVLARDAAQAAEDEAKLAEYEGEADAGFSITPKYAELCARWFAAIAARSALCQDPRKSDAPAGSSNAEFWWPSHEAAPAALKETTLARLGITQSDTRFRAAMRSATNAANVELGIQCELLREIFDEFLGPPGDEGAWLPCGFDVGPSEPAEQWCLLPSARKG